MEPVLEGAPVVRQAPSEKEGEAAVSSTQEGGSGDEDDDEAFEEEEFGEPHLRRLKRGHDGEASSSEARNKEQWLGMPKIDQSHCLFACIGRCLELGVGGCLLYKPGSRALA